MENRLKQLIEKKTSSENRERVLNSIESMLCCDFDIHIDEKRLYDAISNDGEFFVLLGDYEAFDLKQQNRTLRRKLNEALEIIVSFEDDGNQYEKIEKFVQYIYKNTDNQKFSFGIKKVKHLSASPVKILFTAIYPINQLEIHLGKSIYDYIELNKNYLQPYFVEIRQALSKEIGINILALESLYKKSLKDEKVELVDSVNGDVLVEFYMDLDKVDNSLDHYLMKLYYIFIKLGKKYKH